MGLGKRICHVCNGHPVDDGRVFHRTCVGLAKAGYEVHLFAVSNRSECLLRPGCHTFIRCPSAIADTNGLHDVSRCARMAADLNPDLFHVHEPELLGSVLAVAGSRPVVYDVHESYLDIIEERDWIPQLIKPIVRSAWDRWERRLVRRCAGVVAVTERIGQRYFQLHPESGSGSQLPGSDGRSRDLPPVPRDGITCVFAGLLTHHRGLSQIVEALAILKRRGLAVPLALAGSEYAGGVSPFLVERGRSAWCQRIGKLPRCSFASRRPLCSSRKLV